MVNPRVVGPHEGNAALAPHTADHLLDAALDDFDQRAFPASVAVDLHHPGHHSIAVHQRAHLAGREEQVGARVVGPEEAEAVPVPDHAPGDEIHPVDEAELPPAGADDLAVARHGAQAALQRLALVGGVERVRVGNPGERNGGAALREEVDQRAAFGQVGDTWTGAASGVAGRVWGAR